jgi:ribosomal protein S18 acetylase RimI-like enzyme
MAHALSRDVGYEAHWFWGKSMKAEMLCLKPIAFVFLLLLPSCGGDLFSPAGVPHRVIVPVPAPTPTPAPKPSPVPGETQFVFEVWPTFMQIPAQIRAGAIAALNDCFAGEATFGTGNGIGGEIYLAKAQQTDAQFFAAMLSLYANSRLPEGLGQGGFIANVCTAKAWRSRGLATELIKRVISNFRAAYPDAKGLSLYVWQDNAAARSVYEKLGFVQVRRFQISAGKFLLLMLLRFS